MPKPIMSRQRDPMVRKGVRVDAYGVISRAVEEGLGYGIGRLYKHDDAALTEDDLRERRGILYDAITNALCEVLKFDE